MKYVVALNGSNVPGGNTDLLLSQAILGAAHAGCTVERVNVPLARIKPCLQLYHCIHAAECAIPDDAGIYYQMLRQADGIIIASPIMTYGIPGTLKSFFDRCNPFYFAKYSRGTPLVSPEHAKLRRTLFLCISGMDRDDIFDGAIKTVQTFCSIVDSPYFGGVFQNNMDEIRDIRTKPEKLREAYEAGHSLGTYICTGTGEA